MELTEEQERRLAEIAEFACADLDRMHGLTYQDVVNNAVMVMNCRFPGIYFLMEDSEIVYVGQSTDVARRIIEHVKMGKLFNKFYALDCSEYHPDGGHINWLNEFEASYIAKFKPKLNKAFPPNTSFWTLSVICLGCQPADGSNLRDTLERNGVFPEWGPFYRDTTINELYHDGILVTTGYWERRLKAR